MLLKYPDGSILFVVCGKWKPDLLSAKLWGGNWELKNKLQLVQYTMTLKVINQSSKNIMFFRKYLCLFFKLQFTDNHMGQDGQRQTGLKLTLHIPMCSEGLNVHTDIEALATHSSCSNQTRTASEFHFSYFFLLPTQYHLEKVKHTPKPTHRKPTFSYSALPSPMQTNSSHYIWNIFFSSTKKFSHSSIKLKPNFNNLFLLKIMNKYKF